MPKKYACCGSRKRLHEGFNPFNHLPVSFNTTWTLYKVIKFSRPNFADKSRDFNPYHSVMVNKDFFSKINLQLAWPAEVRCLAKNNWKFLLHTSSPPFLPFPLPLFPPFFLFLPFSVFLSICFSFPFYRFFLFPPRFFLPSVFSSSP